MCAFGVKRLRTLLVGRNQKCSLAASPAIIHAVNIFTAGVKEGILGSKRDSHRPSCHSGWSCLILESFFFWPPSSWGPDRHTFHSSARLTQCCTNKERALTRLPGQKGKGSPKILWVFFYLSVNKWGYEGAGEWVRASELRTRWKQGGQILWREAGMQPWQSGQAQTSGLIQLPTDSSKHFRSSGTSGALQLHCAWQQETGSFTESWMVGSSSRSWSHAVLRQASQLWSGGYHGVLRRDRIDLITLLSVWFSAQKTRM